MAKTPTLTTNKYEVALFPKDFPSSTDFNALLEEIKKETDIFTGGVNMVIPTPVTAPPDIPRILLRNKDNSVGCNLSVNRVNIFWSNSREEADYNVKLTDIQNLTEKLSSVILSHTSTRVVKRIGYINELFFVSKEPMQEIKDKIIVSKRATNLREFTFQLTYDLTLEGIKQNCNDYIVITTGQKQTDKKEKIIMLSKDINTVPTEDFMGGIIDIRNFIEKAEVQMNKVEMYNAFFNGDE